MIFKNKFNCKLDSDSEDKGVLIEWGKEAIDAFVFQVVCHII
jgi:hypothetical protein